MNATEHLDEPRAEPDFEAQDELGEWAVENAELLSTLAAAPEKKKPSRKVALCIPAIPSTDETA